MAVAYRNIDLRPFLTADLDSWGQNWSSMGWTVKSKNFDLILRFFIIGTHRVGETTCKIIDNVQKRWETIVDAWVRFLFPLVVLVLDVKE